MSKRGGRRSEVAGRRLSHIDPAGRVRMADVSDKAATVREAVARGHIAISADALAHVRSGRTTKGDPLETARLAGIMAAKQTASLIPLCHPIPITHVDVRAELADDGVRLE